MGIFEYRTAHAILSNDGANASQRYIEARWFGKLR